MKRAQTLHEGLIPALAAELGVTRYLELGIHQNETIGGVMEACPDAYVVGVDRYEPAEWVLGVNYRIMSTVEYLAGPVATDGPFDMVFIDADHNSEAVLTDFHGVWPHVAPDGLVLLHDTNPETVADTSPGLCGDGWKAARQLTQSGHEAVTLPYHPGLTIVRKRVSWGPVDIPAEAGEERHAHV